MKKQVILAIAALALGGALFVQANRQGCCDSEGSAAVNTSVAPTTSDKAATVTSDR